MINIYPSFWWPRNLRSGLHSPLGSNKENQNSILNIEKYVDLFKNYNYFKIVASTKDGKIRS